MKIPRRLPQFQDEKALLIAAARQTAKFYIAEDGTVRPAGALKISTPKYSDREGFFARSGRGKTFATGSVYESRKLALEKEFTARLATKAGVIASRERPDAIYIFSAGYMKGAVRNALPAALRKMIQKIYSGNYTKYHSPLFLLSRIKR